MTLFLQLAFLLSVILLSAKMAGYLSIRLGQPSVLGELLVGILLGPSIINILNLPFIEHELTETIAKLGELGVLLLMFLAGLELHLGEMRQNVRVAALAGLMGVVGPVLLGWGTGLLFNFEQPAAIFLGLTLGATSVSISAQTLIEMKVLRSRVGLSLLGSGCVRRHPHHPSAFSLSCFTRRCRQRRRCFPDHPAYGAILGGICLIRHLGTAMDHSPRGTLTHQPGAIDHFACDHTCVWNRIRSFWRHGSHYRRIPRRVDVGTHAGERTH
ncbi:MAG: cation:proton antiporter [Anaerolineales bacterium]|nr:cation:proton antiporter [Anaerolineales bacterium]